MPRQPNTRLGKLDSKAVLSTISLTASKISSPLYTAETRGLHREIKRRQRSGLDVTAHQNRLADFEQRLTRYNTEIALAAKAGKVPKGAMTITGVVNKHGRPVEGLIIAAYDLDGEPAAPAVRTDTDGSFVLTIRNERSVRIAVSTPDLNVLRCHDVTFEYEPGRDHRTKIDLETTEHVPIDPVYPCSEKPGKGETRTTVPDLIGMSEENAGAELEEAGLTGRYRSEPSSEEEGQVINQSPEAGKTVDRDTLVHVVLAEPEKAIVPEVTNLNRQSAESRLSPTFDVAVISTKDGTSPGKVVRQFPSAGEQVELPHTVTIFITEAEPEPELIPIPHVVEMNLNAGQEKIVEQGFSLGPVTLKQTDGVPGAIIQQSPKGGTKKPAGTPVETTVSIGSKDKKDTYKHLPSVVDLSVDKGKKVLGGAGFSNIVFNQRKSKTQPGTIIVQTPPGGTTQPQETRITLVVASKTGKPDSDKPTKPEEPVRPTDDRGITMPDLADSNLVDAKAKLQEASIENPKLIFEGRSNTLQVVKQKPASGTPLHGERKVTLTVSLPDAWRRNPSLAVSNLYRVYPASANVRTTEEQDRMIAEKLAAMPIDKVEAMLAKGESGIANALTKAKRIDKKHLLAAISFAVQAVRENRED